MIDEELKNIENNSDFKKLKKQANKLKIMMIIQFIFLIIFCISIISILEKNTISSIEKLNIAIPISGCLAILIFFLISKPIDKNKAKFRTNYYDIVMLSIIKKVNSTWAYSDENNLKEIIREFILADFYEPNIDRVYSEKTIKGKLNLDINILIYQMSTIDIMMGYKTGRYKIKKLFNGLFATVETNIDKNLNFSIEGKKGFVKICGTLNDIRIKNLSEDFCKNTLLDFDLIIKNGKIYFKIFSGNKFKEHIFKKLIDKNTLENYYITLKFIQEISNEIIRIT